MFERHSALASALTRSGRDGANGRRALTLGEIRSWSLVQIAAFPGTLPDLERAVEPFLGALPPHANTAISLQGRLLFKIGPQQFWVGCSNGEDLTAAVQHAVPSQVGAVTELSHSRTRIYIEGPAAAQVLASAIALDLHPDVLRLGAFSMTGVHHIPVLLHRSGDERYELYAPRTLALWIWEWLTDAALPYGYDLY